MVCLAVLRLWQVFVKMVGDKAEACEIEDLLQRVFEASECWSVL